MKIKYLPFVLLLIFYGCKKPQEEQPTQPESAVNQTLIMGTWRSVSKVPDYPIKYFGPQNFYYEDIANPYGPSFHFSEYRWGKDDTLLIGPVRVKVIKLSHDSLVYAFDTKSKFIYRYYNLHLPFVDPSGDLSVIAGTSEVDGFEGEGGPALNASFHGPEGVALDKNGNIYVVDSFNGCIRKINAANKTISTIIGKNAGQPYAACMGDDNLPPLETGIGFYNTYNIFVDKSDNIYFTARNDLAFADVIYKLSAEDHKCHIICGKHKGYSGDGGLAINAATTFIEWMTLDDEGNIYFSDQLGAVIRKIDATTGIIRTIGGDGTKGYSGDGGDALKAEIFAGAMAVDQNGGLVFANNVDFHTGYLRKINLKTGTITTIAGTGKNKYDGNFVDAKLASFTYIQSITMNKKGDIILSENSESNHRIRKIDATTNQINTIAGNSYETFSEGGNYLTLRSFAPGIIALTLEGNIITSDRINNRVFQIKF
jgi:sugar lactone lactonase YvrE